MKSNAELGPDPSGARVQASIGVSMPVPMVQVRIVRVLVAQWCVVVRVRVRLAGRIVRTMGMLMMLIMNVVVVVRHRCVSVLMLVSFGQVQQDANAHQHRGAHKRDGDRLAE